MATASPLISAVREPISRDARLAPHLALTVRPGGDEGVTDELTTREDLPPGRT